MRRAASRADRTAGKSSATSTPIIAITTSSSTSVKAVRREREEGIAGAPGEAEIFGAAVRLVLFRNRQFARTGPIDVPQDDPSILSSSGEFNQGLASRN